MPPDLPVIPSHSLIRVHGLTLLQANILSNLVAACKLHLAELVVLTFAVPSYSAIIRFNNVLTQGINLNILSLQHRHRQALVLLEEMKLKDRCPGVATPSMNSMKHERYCGLTQKGIAIDDNDVGLYNVAVTAVDRLAV